MKDSHQEDQIDIAEKYFDYLARHFPVMCASDEFHFLPRAEKAAEYYHELDKLDAETLFRVMSDLKGFQNDLAALTAEDDDLEKQIDIALMQANINGVVIELDQNRTWQHNPIFYLKIAFIGLDHALHKPSADLQNTIARTFARLSQIPRVLNQAVENIKAVPAAYYQASLYMVEDCRQYLKNVGQFLNLTGVQSDSASGLKLVQTVDDSLVSFQRFLKTKRPEPDRTFAGETLERTLNEHFLCIRNLDEIFQIAEEGWNENLGRLEELKSHIQPGKSWQQIYHEYYPAEINQPDTLALYAREIENLKVFFEKRGLSGEALNSALEISETPVYLRSVRGAASFAAAYTSDKNEKSYFYITTRLAHQSDNQVQQSLQKRFHREYRLLTAHEAVPGHHYLDAVRRRLKNPIRRQIESPLFYEGWASYAESLLAEYGYEQSPLEVLVDLKRNLWRAARCQIDVGLTTGRISEADSLKLLEICSFSPGEARRQIDRFRLNPGYQLCYSLGHYELAHLKSAFGTRLGNQRFHEHLLEGGELPFHLIEKRLARICRNQIEE